MQSNDAPHWINPPPFHEVRGDELIVRTGRDTDWWNNTFYGFRHLSGHFLAHKMTGDFSLEATFSAGYRRLYDQAGVMLRVDDNNWLKTGTEFTDGALHFSVVVTRDDQSDWSVLKLGGDIGHPVSVRLTRHAEALRVQRRDADGTWQLVRLAYLKMPETVEVGPMCCSPTGEGLEVAFSHIAFGSPIFARAPRGLVQHREREVQSVANATHAAYGTKSSAEVRSLRHVLAMKARIDARIATMITPAGHNA